MLYKKDSASNAFGILTSLFGIGLFVALYVVATLLYPGGSQADKISKGFSWMHNYWCNLLSVEAMNGAHNAARPVAVTAMIVLCLSLMIFWYYLPRLFNFDRLGSRIIQLSGIISMLSAIFLLNQEHDLVINVAGFFGMIALVGAFVGLYKIHFIKLLQLGFVCALLVAVNNYVYYTKDFIFYLPVIQKITFASVLVWIFLVGVKIYSKKSVVLAN